MNVSRNDDESTNSGQSDGKPWWEADRSWVTDRVRYAEMVERAKRAFPSVILSSALASQMDEGKPSWDDAEEEAAWRAAEEEREK